MPPERVELAPEVGEEILHRFGVEVHARVLTQT
jgi:hypothetical protein